jgi:predicted dehydrogenase
MSQTDPVDRVAAVTPPADRDLRIGVLGSGQRAPVAARAHRPEDGVRIVAVAAPSEAGRVRAQAIFGAQTHVTESASELLEHGIDAVFVLSPDYLHEEHAVTFLEAGVAVFLEKPMATTTEGADRILRAAVEGGGRLFVGHNMRYIPFVVEMKRLIDEGAIGEPKTAWCRHFMGNGGDLFFRDWHADRRFSTGLLLQLGTHDLDALHWLCGGFTRQVVALGELTVYGAIPGHPPDARRVPWFEDPAPLSSWPPRDLHGPNPTIDVEDISMVLMRLSNGVLASYSQCHFAPDSWRNFTVIGTEGRLENFGDLDHRAQIKVWRSRKQGFEPVADCTVPAPCASDDVFDDAVVDEFLAFVRRGVPTRTSPVAAREAVATAFAATQSLREGGSSVAIPELPADLLEHFEPLDHS